MHNIQQNHTYRYHINKNILGSARIVIFVVGNRSDVYDNPSDSDGHNKKMFSETLKLI
jgi:hypothetical protein